ncbi:MAG: YkgJ family cysteine cluster protein [Desulfobacteraceae bacterium]|nr:YkgJ family cysteine cluster protein [Desulfobacteraceae bacterium]
MTASKPEKTLKDLFGSDTNPSHILPRKYTLDSTIKFRCHPGVSCFTACCGNINITLTPFDILRLRKRLGLGAPDFIHLYTTPLYLEKTDMPGVKIKLNEKNRCPFVTPEGCTVYTDRPTTCRYYPVGMANFHERAESKESLPAAEQFYFVVQEPHCKGHEEEKIWTIREWRQDQGVDLCDEMNREWMALVMRRKSFGIQATLSEKAQRMFFMASTDLDAFRSFVFDSSFLSTYEVENETIARIKADDIELMKFSFRFLASALFGTEDLRIKPEKIQAKVTQMKEQQGQAAQRAEEAYRELVEERERLKGELEQKKK